ncbi:Serine/threonine-protein kinase wnk1 [Geranomyces michiganensis]|nr:Serine/threonine-protein kinase wnk1 [Geranomyces michiganensis]
MSDPARISNSNNTNGQILHNGCPSPSSDDDEDHRVIETDPTGRFEKYSEVLGKGAYKDVYKGFDTEEGMEVAWNQLRVDHLLKREAQRILQEIQILQSLRNDNIINLYYSWTARGRDGKDHVYFITELMMSGTLKNYIRKTKGPVKPKVMKSWCRQILSGLAYLHTREPPIIHRDLKCDNIFINGNNGQAKIGDLGLAVVRHRDHVSSVLGTPEFMAPEVYNENYSEAADIYSFGMMVLEIATKEYPYSEASNQARIYRLVSSGIKPAALARVADEETRQFIELCINYDPRRRPTATELLTHPFVLPAAQSSTNILPPGTDPSQRADGIYPSHRSSLTSEHRGSVTSTASSVDSPVTGDSAMVGTWAADRGLTQFVAQQSVAKPVLVDAENHTFEILNRYPLTNAPPALSVYPNPTAASALMTPTTVCSVEIVERLNDTQVLVKMIYGTTHRPPQEIKFPFHYADDTAENVVDEMVKEGIIDAKDQVIASERLEVVVRGSERGSFERSHSSERFNGYPTAVALSPPGSPATFPRVRNQPDAAGGRSATLPRSIGGMRSANGSMELPQGIGSRAASPVQSALTMPRSSANASPKAARAGQPSASGQPDSLLQLSAALVGIGLIDNTSAAPHTVSSGQSMLSSSAPPSGSTSASRPRTPTPLTLPEANHAPVSPARNPTATTAAAGMESRPVFDLGSSAVHHLRGGVGEHVTWAIHENGKTVTPPRSGAGHPPLPTHPSLRDPDLQRKLLEMQEKNLLGFGSLSIANSAMASAAKVATVSSATSALPPSAMTTPILDQYTARPQRNSMSAAVQQHITLSQMQSNGGGGVGVGVGQNARSIALGGNNTTGGHFPPGATSHREFKSLPRPTTAVSVAPASVHNSMQPLTTPLATPEICSLTGLPLRHGAAAVAPPTLAPYTSSLCDGMLMPGTSSPSVSPPLASSHHHHHLPGAAAAAHEPSSAVANHLHSPSAHQQHQHHQQQHQQHSQQQEQRDPARPAFANRTNSASSAVNLMD